MTHYDPAMGELGYEREDHDFYPTEEWVTLAAASFIVDGLGWFEKTCRTPNFQKTSRTPKFDIWECAAGDGAMIGPLSTIGSVYATDLVDRGGVGVTSGVDFLKLKKLPFKNGPSTIVTNPPYTHAEQFVVQALELTAQSKGRVAMLLRNEWDCASERQVLIRDHSAYTGKLVLTSRPRWIRGSKGSPRHNYAWYFWDWNQHPDEYPLLAYSYSKRAY
jgi:hypothetical protein